MGRKGKTLTPKQDRFARYLFEGKSQRDAYVQAGYSGRALPATLDKRACELAKTGEILGRLAELRRQADDSAVMSVSERRSRLSEIARANLRDHIQEGDITIEGPNPGAVAEYSVAPGRWGHRKSIKLRDPVAAITELNKMDRVYSEGASEQAPTVQTFIFVLPDGSRLQPKQLLEAPSSRNLQSPGRPE